MKNNPSGLLTLHMYGWYIHSSYEWLLIDTPYKASMYVCYMKDYQGI